MLVDAPIHLPPRALDTHKGDHGRLLVVAGSRGMSGAAILAGRAALRGGSGLVRLAVPRSIADVVAVAHPCYMTAALPEDAAGRLNRAAIDELGSHLDWCSTVVLGPGLGQSEELREIVQLLLANDRPLVLDADGLNLLAHLGLQTLTGRTAPLVITPHPGEFARLTGQPVPRGEQRRLEAAELFVRNFPGVLVFKGAGTIVADAHRLYINRTGNPGMATGGTGDVLAGLLGSLIGQNIDPFEAAVLAVHVHGLAGDRAAARLGEMSLLATDLLEELPAALLTRVAARS